MPDSIDKLSIEITGTASSATKNLDELANALERITTKTSGAATRLDAIAKSLRSVREAVSGLDLSGLRAIGEIKISSTVAKGLTNIGIALKSIPLGTASQITNLGNAFASLRNLNDLKLTKAVNQLKKLPEVFREYQSFNISGLVNQLAILNTELDHLAVNINGLAVAFGKLPASMRTAGAAARSVAASNKYLSSTTVVTTKSLTSMIAKVGALSGVFYAVVRIMGRCINEANTYIENMNLFNASMGEYASEAMEYANIVQNAMGIDAGEWARNQGVFQTLITGMGETTDRAAIMSQQLTQLGYDIASFYNISVEDAMTKIQSGVAGELEPLRRLGWDLSNARMQLELYNRGIDENVSTMTQADKVALRYYLIMNQVTQVHGDMARTIQSPANQLRILQAQITLTARAIGNLLIPALNAILPYVIAAVKALRLFAQSIANFFGIDINFEVDYSGLDTSGFVNGSSDLDDFGDSAEDAEEKVEELKNSVLGFDELNKLSPLPTDTGDNGESKLPSFNLADEFPLDTYDFLGDLSDEISKKTDELAQKMYDAFERLLPLIAAIGAAIAAWKLGNALLRAIANLLDNLGKIRRFMDDINKKAIKPKVIQPAAVRVKVIEPAPVQVKALPPGPVHIRTIVDMTPLNKLKALASSIGTVVTGSIGKLPAIFTSAIAPLALVAGSYAIMYNQSENFRVGWDDLMSKITSFDWSFSWIADAFQGAWEHFLGILADIGEWWAPIGEKIGEFFSGVWAGMEALGADILNWFQSLGIDLTPVVDAIGAFFGDIGALVGDLGAAVGEKLAITGELVGGWFAQLQEIFQFNLGDALMAAGLAVSLAMGNIGAVLVIGTGWLVSLVIRAYGWGIQECVQEVEVLGDVSEDTKERFGNSMDEMEGAIQKITELDFSNAVITEEDVNDIVSKVEGVKETILDNLDAERNEELAAIDPLKYVFTDEEYQQLTDSINEYYDGMSTSIEEKTAKIGEIYARAAEEHRALTEEEQQQVNSITDDMCSQLVETSGANEEDLKKIREAIKNNDEYYALEAASSVIKAAKDEHDQTIENANDMEAKAKEAMERYAAQQGWTAEQIDQHSQTIENTYQSMRDAADQAFDEIVANTENSLGTLKTKINTETGEILNQWQEFWSGMVTNQRNAEKQLKYSTGENLIFNSQSQSSYSGMTYGATDLSSLADLPDLFSPSGSEAYLEEQRRKRTRGYATGGLPTSGELFLARENGIPEYIGSIGGQNAVANNEQIVEGIKAGVMSAIIEASVVNQSSDNNQRVEIPIYLDRREIARGVYEGNLDLMRRGEITPQYV